MTATRQSDTVNRVPLSITAETQAAIDQKGIKSISDLQATVPALAVSQTNGPGVANLVIRGISDLSTGAATTGFYLDDTPLQKRNATGSGSTVSGAPLPPLFDLERIEVLRGPQGTLFGGSSEGGTIRYITPQPSLTRYSVYARGEVSKVADGDGSYEAGVAVGGPIVEDKLGFRASVFERKVGGWVDYVSPFTGAEVYKNANSERSRAVRLAVTFSPFERLRLTLAYLNSRDVIDSRPAQVNLSTQGPIVAQPLCFNTSAVTPARFSVNPTPVACNSPGVTYTRPGFTLPTLTVGRDDALLNSSTSNLTPTTALISLPTLTVDYDFDKMTFKSVTSVLWDKEKTFGTDALSQTTATYNATYNGITAARGISLGLPALGIVGLRNGNQAGENRRTGITQEFRFASAGNAKPFSWVGGVFFSNMRVHYRMDNIWQDLELVSQTLYGLSAAQRYGVSGYTINGVPGVGFDHDDAVYHDTEVAAFGEGNYWITDRLKLTTGVRISGDLIAFEQTNFGPALNTNTPGGTSGQTTESPITPKVGLQYQATDDDMVYALAAKGFRAGGVNRALPNSVCAPFLPQYGITTADLPKNFKSDTVWNYELGTKLRLLNGRLQLNGDVYRIDWTNAQVSVSLGSGCALVTNSGRARSQGVEIEGQVRLFQGLTANFGFGYTDAKYLTTETAFANPGVTQLIATRAGQHIQVPPTTATVGLRYDYKTFYARADWRYSGAYDGIAQQTFGAPQYAPDNVFRNHQNTNVRVGMVKGDFDMSVFVNNLFDNRDGDIITTAVTPGRSSCLGPPTGTAACTTFSSYNPYFAKTLITPRTIGVQLTYRR